MGAQSTLKAIAAAPLTRHWVTLPNEHLYQYVSAGNPAGPPLLFLHGFTDSWRSVEPLLPYLVERFQVLALDQRGHGDTGAKFDSYRLEDFAGDAIDFIVSTVGRPVTLVGHSLGSLIAQRVAALRPDLVDRLVLIGAADTTKGHAGLEELLAAVVELPDPVPLEFAREFQFGTLHHPIDPAQLDRFVAESHRVPLRVWRAVLAGLLADGQVVSDRIAAPTLILWGDHDAIFDRSAQERLRSAIPDARLVVHPDTGHAPHWERPREAAAEIIAFHA